MFTLDELDFTLPEACIAQEPLHARDAARLLVVHRAAGRLEDRTVRDVPALLRPDDLLVLNDTRVLPARLHAVKPATGARIELLLIEEVGPQEWAALVRPGRRVVDGTELVVEAEGLRAAVQVIGCGAGGLRRVRFQCEGGVHDLLNAAGEMPLPPYIKRREPDPRDRDRYQTVFARDPGAVAAPTAGLHFSPELLAAVRDRGVETAFVTLHVGLGTFQPITEEHVRRGRLHEERYHLPAETAHVLNAARREGRRIVAVGTTVVRVLETVYASDAAEPFRERTGRTDLFLQPGDTFHAVDALMTNFHLPRSSLFALVCAFAGRDVMQRAYAHAIAAGYRFYSYGDATLLC